MKEINPESDIPAELRAAFYNMIKEGVKGRLSNDSDYKKGTGKYDSLDRV
jgi:hypothetical protein